MAVLGFDSSVLSPFARAGLFEALEELVRGHRCVVTPAVLGELDRGCAVYPALANVRTLQWLERVESTSLDELRSFNAYVRVLGSDTRNLGEASILAWAEHAHGIAIVDDQAAVNAARARGVEVRRTLALLCNGIHHRTHTIEDACTLVDQLIAAGGARFPCDGAGFERWAERNGLLAASS